MFSTSAYSRVFDDPIIRAYAHTHACTHTHARARAYVYTRACAYTGAHRHTRTGARIRPRVHLPAMMSTRTGAYFAPSTPTRTGPDRTGTRQNYHVLTIVKNTKRNPRQIRKAKKKMKKKRFFLALGESMHYLSTLKGREKTQTNT